MGYPEDVILDIVHSGQHIHDNVIRYCSTRRVGKVGQYSLIELRWDLEKIIETSRAILQLFHVPSLRDRYRFDDRLKDWLSGDEPNLCLYTLQEMEKSLKIDHRVYASSGFSPTRSGNKEHDFKIAIELFRRHTTHFYFLLSANIWNNENAAPQQRIHSSSQEGRLQEQSQHQPDPPYDIIMEHQRKEIIAQKLDQLLEKLMPMNCSKKHQATLESRQSGTCTWLLETEAYKAWKEGTSAFLWLHGKAGCGKTVLASAVINDLQNTKKDGEFLAYFYCDFRSSRSTSAVVVVCSLLAQLTTEVCTTMRDPEPLLDELLEAARSHVAPFNNPQGVSWYLRKVAGLCPQKPLIVADGLDECLEIESLLDALVASQRDAQVFVTTRPLQSIVRRLSSLPCVLMDEMAVGLSADIKLHVRRELESRPRLRLFNEGIKGEIEHTLCARADGMFRWIQCQIDTLDRCKSVSEIRDILERLPDGLEETYRRILIAINRTPQEARLVRRGLVWLVAALRPMRLRELLEAIIVDSGKRTLDPGFAMMNHTDFLEASRSLVIHHEETDIVTLAHMSVKEYFVGELVRAHFPRYHIILSNAHEHLARLCMAYIIFCLGEMEDCGKRSSGATLQRDLVLATSDASRPFLKYVLSDGFSHVMYLGSTNASILEDMKTLQEQIMKHSWEWDRLCKQVPLVLAGIPWPSSNHDFTMYTLIALASDTLFHTFLDSSFLSERDGTNPLIYAAHFGKTARAEVLLSRNRADVNHYGLLVDPSISDPLQEPRSVGVPVEVAVDRWDTDMLDLLAAHESTIPDQLLTHVLGIHPHRFPLSVIRRLLQTSKFVEWAKTFRDNQRLLDAFVGDVQDYDQMTYEDDLTLVTQKLIQVGFGEALLLTAVERGCTIIVRTLLSTSIGSQPQIFDVVNAVGTNGDTVLHVAIKFSDEKQCLTLTKLLIEHGCNPYSVDADDRPPIQAAVMRGLVSVVKYLSEQYLSSQDEKLPGRILFSALQSPVTRRVEMIQSLVEKGADVHIRKRDGDSLLHLALRTSDRAVCLEIAKGLVDAGCDPVANNGRGETPLSIAAKQGYHEVVNYLMAFSSASDVLTLLRERLTRASTLYSLVCNTYGLRFDPESVGIFQNLADDQNTYPELKRTFIDNDGDLFSPHSISSWLFVNAIKGRFGEVVDFLTSQGIPLPSGILFTALQNKNAEIVPLLVSRGADVLLRKAGNTALHVAVSLLGETGCLRTAKVLVTGGCDPLASNHLDEQPIHIAVSRGFVSVVDYLISQAEQKSMPLPADILFTATEHCERRGTIFQSLVEHGAKATYITQLGDNLLHVLLRSKKKYGTEESECIQIIQTLVRKGCSLLVPDNGGKTPIQIAVENRESPIVANYLLSQNVPVPPNILVLALALPQAFTYKEPDVDHWFSLITTLIRILDGAGIHERNRYQNTALHLAMRARPEYRCLRMVKMLVEANYPTDVRNKDQQTPLDLAVSKNYGDVADFLRSVRPSVAQQVQTTIKRLKWR